MDDASKTNGVRESDNPTKNAVKEETIGPNRDAQKSKKKRSRSRTPQLKSEDTKNLHVIIKKKSEDKSDKVLTEDKEENDDDATRNTRSKTQKEKDEPVKADQVTEIENVLCSNDEALKKDTSPKKGKSPHSESTPKKNTPLENKKESPSAKKETIPKKDSTPKKEGTPTPKKETNSKKESAASPKKETNSKKESAASPKKEAASKKEETQRKENNEKDKDTNGVDSDSVEMDPLLIPDDIEPELLFEENSDMESGKGSPIISRCITRRSLTRNIPTPKTPKSNETDIESEKASTISETDPNNEDELMDSTNVSMKAEAGSDITRLEYADSDSGHDNSYLEISRERSLSETLRSLSARKPIRASDDIRMRVLRSAQEKSDLNVPYVLGDQLRIGSKRKGRSTTPDGIKKFKPESDSTVYSMFSSPITTLRSRFSKTEINSSTPKLLGYRDNKNEIHCEGDYENVHGDDEKKSWCSLM